jgi:AmiR/NasT family two-component response regulator
VTDGHATGELVEELRTKNAQLEHALASRIVIEQAKGILAERYRLTVDEAFEVLRGASRSNRIRIHALAEAVIDSPRTPEAIERQLDPRVTGARASSSASRR